MENSHIPERMCVICRAKKEKEDLFRLAKEENTYIYDEQPFYHRCDGAEAEAYRWHTAR